MSNTFAVIVPVNTAANYETLEASYGGAGTECYCDECRSQGLLEDTKGECIYRRRTEY